MMPLITYYYRGLIERGARYRWVEGWSPRGENGGIQYPWCTKREAQTAEKALGNKCLFVRKAQCCRKGLLHENK